MRLPVLSLLALPSALMVCAVPAGYDWTRNHPICGVAVG